MTATINRRTFLTQFGPAAVAAPLVLQSRARAASPAAPDDTPVAARTFMSRLQPAVVDGGFELPDYWVWCGAPIRGEDDRYHLFASRVPKEVVFHPHWLFRSEIVRAESDTPVGPYRFAEVALPPRGDDFFDARSTHNPHIRQVGDLFLLLYMGTNYEGPTPTPQPPEVWRSPHYTGPWKRQPMPWLVRGQTAQVEDPFLWHEDGRVQALMKDLTGEICGQKFAGVHVTSADGLQWDFDRATLAYTRQVRWSDGRTTRQGFLERPQLLIEDGVPTHLFCATAEGPGIDLKDATHTWNLVFPLSR